MCPWSSSKAIPVCASQTFAVGVITTGDDAGAVGAERHAPNTVRVPFEFEQGFACPRVPDLRRLVQDCL